MEKYVHIASPLLTRLSFISFFNFFGIGFSSFTTLVEEFSLYWDNFKVVEDEPCTSDNLHDIELLLPFMKDACTEGKLALIIYLLFLFNCNL